MTIEECGYALSVSRKTELATARSDSTSVITSISWKRFLISGTGLTRSSLRFLADDGNLYILRQATADAEGEWSLESFRVN